MNRVQLSKHQACCVQVGNLWLACFVVLYVYDCMPVGVDVCAWQPVQNLYTVPCTDPDGR